MDYCKILNVSPNATREEIERSYQFLSRKWNPTTYAGRTKAEKEHAQMMYDLVNDAYKAFLLGCGNNTPNVSKGNGKEPPFPPYSQYRTNIPGCPLILKILKILAIIILGLLAIWLVFKCIVLLLRILFPVLLISALVVGVVILLTEFF